MQASVMIASSYPLVVEGVKSMLMGCDDISVIDTVVSCCDVVGKLKETAPDIAILDAQLSDGCGFELVKTCAKEQIRTRFLVISSFDTEEQFNRAMEAGAHALLLRSIARNELIAAVRAVAANQMYVQPKLATALFLAKEPLTDVERALPPRQIEIIEFMAQGLSNKEIAGRLNLSTETINTHVKHILKKLNAKDRAQAVAIAIRNSIIA